MADFMNKYVKKSRKRSKPAPTKAGSWMSNALKSLGYSSFDVLSDLMPSTVDVAKATTEAAQDLATSLKTVRSTDKTLKQSMEQNYYFGLGKDILKNSLEDLKSGKFYNRDRTDQYFADMDDEFDLGDFDFGDDEDFDSDDFSDSIESDDGNARASFHRKKGGGNDITNIAVSTDIGPDSTLVQATEFQTETTINVGRAVVDNTRIQNRAMMNMIGGMRTELNSSLVSMSDNISQITSVVSETISKHTALSAKYYEDSIAIQSQILEHVKQMPTANTNMNTREFKDYNNVMDIISSGGALDFKAYGKLIKKQANNYIESNPFLSQLKFMNDNKEALQMTALSPFQKIMTNMVKSAIPKMMQNAMTKFDEQLKETGIAALNQVNGLRRSQNPILSAIGQIFGLQNKITKSNVDKSAYNKGAMSWSGTDHQALTNVIPTLLRKIYASVSGNEEIVFDYNEGIFKNLSEVEKDFDKEKKYHQTSEYSDYKSGFNEFLTKTYAMSPEDKKKFSEDFNTFIGNLVKDQYGGRTFRRGGRDGKQTNENGEELDDIRDLLGGETTSDSKNVQLIRAYLQSLESTDKAALTRFFGSNVQNQRAVIDRWVKEMQVDPTKYNVMYQQTGLKGANSTNAHLEYGDKNDPSKITGIKSGIAAGVVDKYKHNANYYLREILNTLTTGIYVVPIGGFNGGDDNTDGGSILSAINARRDSVSSKITKEGTKLKTEQAAQTTVKNSYSDENKQKDIDKGKIDIENDDLTQTQIDVLGNGEARGEDSLNNEEKRGFLSKLADKVPADTGLGKIIDNIRKKRNDAGEKGTGLFNKLNTALFDFVFGTGEKQGGIKGLVSVGINGLKAGFASFGSFLDKKIFQPLNNALFGEDGLVSKIKESDFGKKMSETFGKIKDKMGTFFLGEKDSEGKRSGGLFSETANSLKDIGKNVKESILGKKGPDGKPLPLDQDDSVVGNLRKMFHRVTGSIGESLGVEKSEKPLGARLNDTIKSAFGRIRDRASDWTNAIFGSDDEEGTTKIFNEKFASEFKEDMSKNKGYIGATTGIGAVASIFLPGGPIGGALLGAGFGIIKKSRGLQELLFGPEDEETGERMGGIINKETQEFFKKHKTGMKIGAIGGLAASVGILPSFFLPGGPIGGALIGTGISLIAKSGAFDELLYGPGGTKDDPTGGLSKKFKEIFGKNKSTKGLALDAGIGAGVGLIGSFFLPGGPILGALIGSAVSVGTATDKFRTWFFGPEKDGKRQGGIFGKFKGKMQNFFLGEEKDGKREGGLLTSLKKTAQLAQVKIGRFVEENMIVPFKNGLEPLTESAKKTGAKIKEKVTDLFDSIKEKFNTAVVEPVGKVVKKHFVDPMKNFLKSLFRGLGNLIGGIISAPFKMFEAAGKGSYERQKRKGQDAYKSEIDTKLNPLNKDNWVYPEDDKRLKGVRAFGGAIKNWWKARTDKDALYDAQFRDEGAGWDRGNERKWDQRAKDRYEETRKKWDDKEAAIRNGYSPKDISTGSGKKSTKNTTVDTTPNNFVDAFVSDDNLSKGSKFKASGNSDIDALDIMQGAQVKDKTSVNTDIDALDIMMEAQSGSSSSVKTKSSSRKSKSTKQSRKKDRKGNRKRRNAKRHDDKAYEPKTSKPPKVEEYKPETTSVKVESSNKTEKPKKDKGLRGKDSNTLLSQIQKDVSKISDSVYGQMNGVGSNVNKIYRLLLKKFGKKDSDIKGDNNKEYVGFWGKIRTALNNPLKAFKNAITAPFRKIKEKISGGLKKVKNFGTRVATGFKNFGKELKKVGASLLSGIGSLVKGIGRAAAAVGGVAVDIIHTGLSAVRAMLPAVGEVLKTGVALIGDGLRAAGSILVTGVKSLGNIVQNAATGFGKLLGGAMSGLGSILSAVGLIGKDVITGIWKGLKFAGKGIVNGVGNLASRIGGKNKGNGKFGRGKGPFHVIVDSGTLDKVKLVNVVELVKRISGKSTSDTSANFTGVNSSGRTGSMPLNLQFFAKKKDSAESGETSVNNSSDNKDSKKTSLGSIFGETKNKLKGIGDEFREKISKRSEDRVKQVEKGSRQSILSRLADRDKEKSENKFKDKVLGLLGRSADAGEKHAFSFMKVFDLKKGLITAGLILLAPFIIRFFKKFNIGALLTDLLQNAQTGIQEVGGISGVINNVKETYDQGKDVIDGKDTHHKIDENGNLVYDENGNLVDEQTESNALTELLMPTRTRINTETGKWENRKDWTTTSDAIASKGISLGFDVAKKGKKIAKVAKPVVGAVKTAGKAAFDYATLKSDKLASLAIHADDAVKAVKGKAGDIATAAYVHADDALKAVKGKVSGVATKVATGTKSVFETVKGNVAVKAANNEGIIGKAINMMQKALNFLVEKFAKLGEKYGVKIAGSNIGIDAVKGILTKSKLAKYTEKITNFVKKIAGKAAASGSTLFLAELGFIMYGAIDGASNAGALFEVNPKDVDAKMRAIAGVFKALLNTSIGSWVDLINSLVYEILGFSFIKTIATHVYNLLSSDKKQKELDEAQKKFTDDYETYVKQEYEAYVEDCEEQGVTPMSEDEFKASDLSTTRNEYNSKTNKSIARRVVDAVKGVKKGVTSVGSAIKNAPKNIVTGVKNLGKTIKNAPKNIATGVKNLGTNIKNTAVKVGTGIKNFGSKVANSKLGKKVGETKDKVVTGIKKTFSNVGSSLGKAKDFGVEAASALATGYKKIVENYKDKENGFLDYMKADVNVLKEDNPFYGLINGVLNVSKVVMLPRLIVAGIMIKLGKTIGKAVTKIFTGAKNAATDYATNVASIDKLAFTGDVDGLKSFVPKASEDNPISGFTSAMAGISRFVHIPVAYVARAGKKFAGVIKNAFTGLKNAAIDHANNVANIDKLAFTGDVDGLKAYEPVASDDNPISGFTSGIAGISRFTHVPLAYVARAGKKFAGVIKNAFTGLKIAATDYANNVAGINKLAWSGDVDGLKAYEPVASDDNPISGFTSGIAGISRFVHMPVAYIARAGKNVAGHVRDTIGKIATTGSQITTGVKDIATLAISGDVNGVKSYQEIDEEGNPIGGFANSVVGAAKFAFTPVSYVAAAGRKAAETIRNGIGKFVDFGGKVKGFITTLNTYTDTSKSLDGWESETMASGEDDFVGNIASSIIKKIMWIYVGIVRGVKNAFGFVTHLGGTVTDIASTVKNSVENTVSGIAGGIKGAVDKIGTFLMNLGRGGEDGGRPIAGGRGGNTSISYGKGGVDEANGDPYYSQNDPRYKNKKYKQTGGFGSSELDTMGESGCGPTAMAMVATKVTGKEYDPMTMAKMSEQGGYSTSLGTSPEYFVNTANKLGISSTPENPSADNLINSVAQGDSIIMQGVKSSGTNSPFTTDGHYVTIAGMDNGNVVVNDPRGKEFSGQYRLRDVLKDATGMWAFAPGGRGGNSAVAGRFFKGGKGADLEKWMNIVKAVKQAIAAQKPGYSQSNYISITVGGKTLRVRTDCSGYVGACLKYYGVLGDSTNITSSTVTDRSSKVMKSTGFSPAPFPGWNNLQQGDILGVNGHTEIFAYNKDGKHYVYNCGSDSSTNSPVPTVSGHSSYTSIWRCGGAGSNAITNTGVSGSTSGSGTVEDNGLSSFTELLSGAASAFTDSILGALGFKTGDDESGDTGGGAVASANITGSNVAKSVWDYFTGAGYSKAATAGIMGNFSQESGMNPASIQGNGKGPAAGIAQWENYNTKSSRWKQLQDYASSKGKSWTDLGSQLEFVNKEMQGNDFKSRISGKTAPSNLTKAGTSGISFDAWKKTDNVEAATRQWEAAYERAGKPMMANRISAAKEYYKLYGGGKGGSNGGRPIQAAFGGYGDHDNRVSSGSSSMQSSSSDLQKIIETNNISNNLSSSETSQLLNTMITYLSMIVDNTGDTSDKLEELNDKDFGYTTNNNVVNTTNNVSNNNLSKNSSPKSTDKTADRSKYDMAKRVAAGIIS